jgi:predicted GIY-YIG superfamily endonuclease
VSYAVQAPQNAQLPSKTSPKILFMRYVYLLQSIAHPQRRYVGSTTGLKKRLQEHNSGKSPHTSKFRPWKIMAAIYIHDDGQAIQFERYLKSGSGHAFAKRHLWP